MPKRDKKPRKKQPKTTNGRRDARAPARDDDGALIFAPRRPAYERQPQEPAAAWGAFVAYRDLGPMRSLEKLVADRTIRRAKFDVWFSEWRWEDRCFDWDGMTEKVATEEHIKTVRTMARRHANLARVFQEKILERLESIDPTKLAPGTLAKWLDISVKVERLSANMPTVNVLAHGNATRADVAAEAERLEELGIGADEAAHLGDQLARLCSGQSLGTLAAPDDTIGESGGE